MSVLWEGRLQVDVTWLWKTIVSSSSVRLDWGVCLHLYCSVWFLPGIFCITSVYIGHFSQRCLPWRPSLTHPWLSLISAPHRSSHQLCTVWSGASQKTRPPIHWSSKDLLKRFWCKCTCDECLVWNMYQVASISIRTHTHLFMCTGKFSPCPWVQYGWIVFHLQIGWINF